MVNIQKMRSQRMGMETYNDTRWRAGGRGTGLRGSQPLHSSRNRAGFRIGKKRAAVTTGMHETFSADNGGLGQGCPEGGSGRK
jgi:hypothetical protein